MLALLIAALVWWIYPKGSTVPTMGKIALFHQSPFDVCRTWNVPTDPYADVRAQDVEAVFEACTQAVQSNPNNADIAYRLGASALESEHTEEAFLAFKKAESLGNCKSLYHLGRFAWGDRDDLSAEDYYRRGAECGDERASHELFDPTLYRESAYPEHIQALYDSNLVELNRVRFLTASYVAGFYETLSEQFLGKDFDPCWASTYYRGGNVLYGIRAAEQGDASNVIESLAYEKSLPIVFHILFPAQGSKALEEIRETSRKAGHADLIRMIRSSHCGALLPFRVLEGVRKFSESKKSLLSTVSDAAPNVHSISDLLGFLSQVPRDGAAREDTDSKNAPSRKETHNQ